MSPSIGMYHISSDYILDAILQIILQNSSMPHENL